MKTLFVLFFLVSWYLVLGQDSCRSVAHFDDYQTTTGWVTEGVVSITGGVCFLDEAEGHAYNRAYRVLDRTISDSYWKAEARIEILQDNPSGSGVGAFAIALTAGTLDFTSDINAGFIETNQDGIGAAIWSPSEFDNDRNNWQFIIEAKKGTTRTYSGNGINLSTIYDVYYLRLERIGSNAVLSVFTDANFQNQLAGSPIVFGIDNSITNLSCVQHGNICAASHYREISASIDSLYICDNLIDTVDTACVTEVHFEDFSNGSGWSCLGNVYVSNNVINLDNTQGRSYHKAYMQLTRSISDTYWKAEADFHINDYNEINEGVGVMIVALTAGNQDFTTTDYSSGLNETNQDGVSVFLWSPSEYDGNMNNWMFIIESKNGSSRTYSATGISANSSQMDYYIVLERLSLSETRLRVFSDAAHNNEMPGSPVSFTIDDQITGLNYLQIGSVTAGAASRVINAYEDNISICDNIINGVGLFNDFGVVDNIEVFPNPASDFLNITSGLIDKPFNVLIYNLLGELVYSSNEDAKASSTVTFDLGFLVDGSYILCIESAAYNQRSNGFFIISR